MAPPSSASYMMSRWSGGRSAEASSTEQKALRSAASFCAAGRRCHPRMVYLMSERVFSGVSAPFAFMCRSVVKLGDILEREGEAVQVAVIEGLSATVADPSNH
eukprot:scaffold7310_cov28-Tisochrysis_lutea.AAC.1